MARPGAVLLGHRAERRAVVRTADVFVKVVPPERAERIAAAAAHATALAARAGLRAPALVDAEPAAGVVCFAPLAGTPLREALAGAGAADALRATGGALRRLHACRAPAALPVHDAAARGRRARALGRATSSRTRPGTRSRATPRGACPRSPMR